MMIKNKPIKSQSGKTMYSQPGELDSNEMEVKILMAIKNQGQISGFKTQR